MSLRNFLPNDKKFICFYALFQRRTLLLKLLKSICKGFEKNQSKKNTETSSPVAE